MTKNFTIKEFAAVIGEDYIVASSFIKVLVGAGAAKEVGKRPAEGGKGKPSTVYEIDREIELELWQEENQTENVESAPETEEKIKSELGVETVTIG